MPDRRADPVLLAISIAAALAGLILFARLGPPGTFWTVDDAGKSLVVGNLRRDPTSTSLEYPGRRIDPEYRFFPQPMRGPERYATLRGGRAISQYLSPFTWLALPFAATLGFVGLGLLPALGAGAVVFLGGVLAATVAGSPRTGRIAAGILLASTPLLFYGSVFWEHSLTTALVTGAFLALATSPRRSLLAGLLLGGACFLREEMGLLLSAVVLMAMVTAARHDAVRVAIGGLAGLAARATFHLATSGSILGVHAGLNRPAPFENVREAMGDLLWGTGFSGLPATVSALAMLLLVAALFVPRRFAVLPLGLSVALLFAISAVGWRLFPGREDSALALIHSNSAALFVPWALVAPFLRDRAPSVASATHLVGRAVILFLVLFLILVPARSITGVHPGPRMLLPLLPFVAALAATRVSRSRVAVVLLAPLLLTSALWNLRSLELLHAKRTLAGELVAALEARPEKVVVTDLFWLPTEMASLWDRKEFHLITSDRGLEELAARASAAGERTMLAAVEPGRIPAAPVAAVRRDGFSAFSVDLHILTLKPGSP